MEKALLRLERDEEALIEAAERQGQIIPRRPTASPQAVLGVDVRAADKVHPSVSGGVVPVALVPSS